MYKYTFGVAWLTPVDIVCKLIDLINGLSTKLQYRKCEEYLEPKILIERITYQTKFVSGKSNEVMIDKLSN